MAFKIWAYTERLALDCTLIDIPNRKLPYLPFLLLVQFFYFMIE